MGKCIDRVRKREAKKATMFKGDTDVYINGLLYEAPWWIVPMPGFTYDVRPAEAPYLTREQEKVTRSE